MSRAEELLAELARSQEPGDDELDALESAVLAKAGRRPSRTGWIVAAAGLAACVLGAVSWVQPGPSVSEIGAGPASVAVGVRIDAQGAGRTETSAEDTTLHWEGGRIDVEVDPQARTRVWVRTDEATVRVTGTAFTVDRDGFGTLVLVSRGQVEVWCQSDEVVHLLDGGGEVRCLRDADAGLGWIVALEARRTSAEAQLDAIRRAQAHPVGTPQARAALRVRELGVLARLGEVDRVLRGVAELPAADRHQVLATAAGHALDADGCVAALPWLEVLLGDGDVVGGLLLAQCLQGDPARAGEVLDRLLGLDLSAEQRQVVDGLRARLP